MGNCKHKIPCGCGDSSLTTPASCNPAETCSGERCSELFSQECIAYNGEPIAMDLAGSLFEINPGDRLDYVIQSLLHGFAGATQYEFAPRYRVIAKTSTSITIEFEAKDGLEYYFNAQQQSPIVNNGYTHPAGSAGTFTYTFSGLVSGATYIIFSEQTTGPWEGVQTTVILP